ncbi:glycosylated lysosomal membrane protein B-like isoform X2 [Lycorma delicatula]|uniref:glycosylated lysosomal membrane protein B-like isoform X2 n=1 Tax=Lycorma delicatula TaxID=130591 RepID=UPI003F50FF15
MWLLMFIEFKKMWFCCLFCILIVHSSQVIAHKRKLSTTINPGCQNPKCDIKNESSALLVHVRADGENDTLHHIWDFTDSPSLLLVHTFQGSLLNISWDKYLETDGVSVNFSEPPLYIFGVVIDKVFEFNDVNDVGRLNISNNDSNYIHLMNTRDFHWKLSQSLVNDTDTALLSIEGKRHGTKHNTSGIIRITMGAYGGSEHGSILPHLLHSSNSSQMDITLENMPSRFQYSRYGISLVTITSDNSNSSMKLNVRKILDDEHDPGVFTIVEITSPESQKVQHDNFFDGGYLQWRPVVYTATTRDATYSVDSLQYDVTAVFDNIRLSNTLFYKLFGDNLSEHSICTTNVTFGGAGDIFYNKTDFASWTFVAGIGQPIEEKFSMLVILIVAIGLGVPVLLIILGRANILLLPSEDDILNKKQ